MKRNNAEQIGALIRNFLRQESLESPLNERRLISAWPKCWVLPLHLIPVNSTSRTRFSMYT